ncbi:hypothetical protein WJX84_001770, partial [Apatococcus fuscideae]
MFSVSSTPVRHVRLGTVPLTRRLPSQKIITPSSRTGVQRLQ